MKMIYVAILTLLISSSAFAQNYIEQDSIFGDNVVQQNNYYSRPKVVKKVVRTGQKNVYNTYNIYENTTVAPPPVTVVTPPPVTVVRPVPVPVVPYYAPVPVVPVMPVPVYGGYYGYY